MDELKNLLRKYNFRKNRKELVYNTVKWALVSCILLGVILWLEIIFRLDSLGRSTLFYSYCVSVVVLGVVWLARNLKGLFHSLSQEDYESLAMELGKELPVIGDKWLNLLQLNNSMRDNPFVMASVEQSIIQLTSIRWINVVQLSRREKRFVGGALLSVLIIGSVLSFSKPTVEASKRIYLYNEEKEAFAPYHFSLLDSTLEMYQGESYTVRIAGLGEELPRSIDVYNDDLWLGTVSLKDGEYALKVKDVRADIDLVVRSNDYTFPLGSLWVYQPVELSEVISTVQPLAYTAQERFSVDRLHYRIPVGSSVNIESNWTQGTRSNLSLDFTATRDTTVSLSMTHQKTDSVLNVKMDIRIIPDDFPSIEVREDSLSYWVSVDDDYGLIELRLIYVADDGKERRLLRKFLSGKEGDFNFGKYQLVQNLPKGIRGSLFFEIWDNDGYSGSKSSRSTGYSLHRLSEQEEKQLAQKSNSEYASSLSEKKEDLEKINDEIADLEDKVKKGEKLDWNDELKLQELQRQRDKVLKNIQESKPMQQDQYSEDILKKQQEIEELRKAVFDEEFLKELEELKKDLESDDLKSELEKWQKENESIEEALERELEWLKELEFEKLAEDLIEDLKDLSENLNSENLDQWDSLSTELEQLDSLNNELEDPMNMDAVEEQKESTQQEMENTSEDSDSDQIEKAKQSLQELQKTLAETLEDSRDKDVAEDAESLRKILDGLVEVSTAEENIFKELATLDETSSNYKTTFSKQLNVDRDWQLLKDSLSRLADRQPSVAKIVYEKLGDIEIARAAITEAWQGGNGYVVLSEQQKSMMYYNDLALMLSQVLNSMQMQMNSKKSGKGKCDKPGGAGAKPSKSKMSKMQKGMQQQMEEMLDKNGKSKGEKGKSPGKGKSGTSGKDLMKLAMQQQMIREAMQDAMKGLEGEEAGQGEKLLEDLEEIEEDILNGNVSRETIDKMREIESKLLDFEESVLEQGEDDERESSNSDLEQENIDYEEYFKQQRLELEKLRLEYWELNGYYDFIVQ